MTQTIDPSWETFIIGFGKHKSKPISQILKEEPGYVKWLSENSFFENVKTAAQYVIAGKPIPEPEAPKPVDDVIGSFKISFGKHTGKTMGEIYLIDKSYIAWLAHESYIPAVKENARAIIDNDPEHVEKLKTKRVNKEKLVKLSTAISSDFDFKMSPGFGHGKTLYPYQEVAAEFLERADGCAMISDTVGLGKSAESLTYLQNHSGFRPAIIVCPKSVTHQWYQYCYEWLATNDLIEIINGNHDEFMGDIIILNYDILKKNLSQLKTLNSQIIIFDEFHKLKNYKTQRTIAAVDLASEIPHKILLSGTPLFNRTSELWIPLTIIDPDNYNRHTFHKWHRDYCDSKQTKYGWNFSGNSNTKKLAEKLKHINIRRNEEDVFDDLPSLIRTVIPVNITNRHTYNKARNDHIAWIREEQGKDAADRANRAEHLTRIEYLKQLVATGKLKYSIQWINDFLTSEDKLVVFTTHKNITNDLMKEFGKSALKIDGSTPTGKERLNIANNFETNPEIKLLVGNMQAMAEGLNLGASKAVLFLEQSWSPKLHEQCEGRIRGLRQAGRGRKLIYSYYINGIDTIDVEIAAMLEAKRKVLDTMSCDKVKLDFDFFSKLVK
jgi:SNF2 family DNA or RNA helicase